MNLKKALKLIKEFKETDDYVKLVLLEDMLIEAIKLENVAETTSKTRYNKALRVLRRNKTRNILQYTVERNNKQYFTDSYVLFELTNKIPELPIIERESDYPNVYSILESAENNSNGVVEYNCKELKQMIKLADEYVVLDLDETYKAVVNKVFLLDVLTILNYKNSESVIMNYNTTNVSSDTYNCIMQPLLFKREQDVAILMPIRVGDKIAEKLEIK